MFPGQAFEQKEPYGHFDYDDVFKVVEGSFANNVIWKQDGGVVSFIVVSPQLQLRRNANY
jgi:hypothetical protein